MKRVCALVHPDFFLSPGIEIIIGQFEGTANFMESPFVGIELRKEDFRDSVVKKYSGMSKMLRAFDYFHLPRFVRVEHTFDGVIAALFFPMHLGQRQQQVSGQFFSAEKA